MYAGAGMCESASRMSPPSETGHSASTPHRRPSSRGFNLPTYIAHLSDLAYSRSPSRPSRTIDRTHDDSISASLRSSSIETPTRRNFPLLKMSARSAASVAAAEGALLSLFRAKQISERVETLRVDRELLRRAGLAHDLDR